MGTEVTDAGLEHLKGLTQLQSLSLMGAKVPDRLENLKGLRKLRELCLMETHVTNAGLEHLEGLSQLQVLDLAETKVTDAGLEHLKAMAQLQGLNFESPGVTDAGLEHLKGLGQLQELCLAATGHRQRREETPAGVAEVPDIVARIAVKAAGPKDPRRRQFSLGDEAAGLPVAALPEIAGSGLCVRGHPAESAQRAEQGPAGHESTEPLFQ